VGRRAASFVGGPFTLHRLSDACGPEHSLEPISRSRPFARASRAWRARPGELAVGVDLALELVEHGLTCGGRSRRRIFGTCPRLVHCDLSTQLAFGGRHVAPPTARNNFAMCSRCSGLSIDACAMTYFSSWSALRF
jgi:hypothetical protein